MQNSQTERLYNLLSDGLAHRTDEIVDKIYSGGFLARVGARVWDVKNRHTVRIVGWKDKANPALYWYRMEKENNSRGIKIESVEYDTVARINKINPFAPIKTEPKKEPRETVTQTQGKLL